MGHIHHVAEHIAEEGADHTEEHGIIKDICPAVILCAQFHHTPLDTLGQQRHQDQADHDAHRHNGGHRDIVRRRRDGGIGVQPQLRQ